MAAIGNGSLGPKVKIPNKTYPNSKFWGDNNAPLIISEEDKMAEDMLILKKLIRQYEELGRRHIYMNRAKIIKNFNLANGVIDKRDYIKGSAEIEAEMTLLGESLHQEEDFNLEFYPIIPNIINALVGVLGKSKIDFSVFAVNRDAQNEILETKNNMVRDLLVSKAMAIYNAQLEQQGVNAENTPDIYQQQMEIFQSLPKIQKYTSTEFRLSVEQWANKKLSADKRLHNFAEISKQALRNKLICDRPYVHIDLKEDRYRPQVLKPENCAYLKSPYTNDVSEGYMFMWYEYDSPTTIIQNYGEYMNDEDIEKLKQRFLPTRFTVQTGSNYQFDNQLPIEADIQNFLAFRSELDTSVKHRGEEYRDNLIEILHMYVQVPRKLFRLTIKTENEAHSSIVDETYKVTLNPRYEKGRGKTSESLIFGEHLEPFYINELWRVAKINFSRNPNPKLNYDVWLKLEKYPVQLSNPKISKFGSYIPVHGGPTTNEYSETNSIVDRASPWQILYNFLNNRIDQILQTEIGQFFLLNQNALPQESMDGSWGKNNFIKFALTARDTGVGLIDNSPANLGGANPVNSSFGQKVDMSRTEELLQKVELAERFKQECYEAIGISKQFLAQISPNESATGIAQGIQQSLAQIKPVYDEHFITMEKVLQTMLELAKFISIKNGGSSDVHITDEGERIIFQTDAMDFPLYDLGVFATTSFDDTLLLAEMKQLVKLDNTMGADLQEKFLMMSANSQSEVIAKLKEIRQRKDQLLQQQQQEEQKRVQLQIESNERIKAQQIEWEREKLLLQLESNENIQEMKVIGQSNFAQGSGVDELIKYKKSELDQNEYYASILEKAQNRNLKETELETSNRAKQTQEDNKMSLEREKIQLKREELLARTNIEKTRLAIAKENRGQ